METKNPKSADKLPFQFSDWVGRTEENEIRRLLRYSPKYYFAGGKPGVIPVKIFHEIIRNLMDEETQLITNQNPAHLNNYNYGPTEGSNELRSVLSKRLITRDGLQNITKSDVIITNGSQQALYSLCDTLLTPGDIILTTRPSYLGFLQCVEKLGGKIVTLPSDKHGMITDFIPDAISACIKRFRQKPKILYTIPYSDNPQGTTLSDSRKKAIFDYAYEFDYLIFEDMAYKEIQFSNKKISPIKKNDLYNEKVAYLSTSTKEAASFRIGYSVVPTKLRNEMIKAKGIYDLCSSEWVQAILTRYYDKYIDDALIPIKREYKQRCNAMVKSVKENLQGTYSKPTGGFFVWFKSNDTFDSTEFVDIALKNNISFVPGKPFFPSAGYDYQEDGRIKSSKSENNTMRLSYSLLKPKDIWVGIEKLGHLLSTYLQESKIIRRGYGGIPFSV